MKLCHLCRLPFPDCVVSPGHALFLTVDHIIPISRGGSRKAASNRAPAHYSCNRLKGNRLLEELDEKFYMQATGGAWTALARLQNIDRKVLHEARKQLDIVSNQDLSMERFAERGFMAESYSRWEGEGGSPRNLPLEATA